MKASKAYKNGRFNVMNWDWRSSDEVIVSLIDHKRNKAGKFKAKFSDGKIDHILEDEDMS